ncbi:MAG: hypothetical protein MZV64_18195 [Ignavibacteriales bacterium]|nr:hypothetical protein [Ignavibacteriales bacterium]
MDDAGLSGQALDRGRLPAGPWPSPPTGKAPGSSSARTAPRAWPRSGSTASSAGTHEGGFTAFEFDVTGALPPGRGQHHRRGRPERVDGRHPGQRHPVRLLPVRRTDPEGHPDRRAGAPHRRHRRRDRRLGGRTPGRRSRHRGPRVANAARRTCRRRTCFARPRPERSGRPDRPSARRSMPTASGPRRRRHRLRRRTVEERGPLGGRASPVSTRLDRSSSSGRAAGARGVVRRVGLRRDRGRRDRASSSTAGRSSSAASTGTRSIPCAAAA